MNSFSTPINGVILSVALTVSVVVVIRKVEGGVPSGDKNIDFRSLTACPRSGRWRRNLKRYEEHMYTMNGAQLIINMLVLCLT